MAKSLAAEAQRAHDNPRKPSRERTGTRNGGRKQQGSGSRRPDFDEEVTVNRQRGQSLSGQVLQATSNRGNSGAGTETASSGGATPRDFEHRPNVTTSEAMRDVHEARVEVESLRQRAITLYALYDALNGMSSAEVASIYPNGGHEEAVYEAATRYNAVVTQFKEAEERLRILRAGLTGGQDLNGNVLSELNALMGEQG